MVLLGRGAVLIHRFWWVLGAKMGGEIEPKSIKNLSKKASKKQLKKEGVLEASWAVLKASWRHFSPKKPTGHAGLGGYAWGCLKLILG